MEDRRWLKLYRKFVKWEWYKDTKTKCLFIHLLLNANYEDTKWQGIEIKRGQLITSLKNLSLQNNISVKSIRTSLERLKTTNEVACKTTSKFTIITILNYNRYQDKIIDDNKPNDTQLDKRMANKGQTNGKQTTTVVEIVDTKDTKNLREERNNTTLTTEKNNFLNFFNEENKNKIPCLEKLTEFILSKHECNKDLLKVFIEKFIRKHEEFILKFNSKVPVTSKGSIIGNWETQITNWFLTENFGNTNGIHQTASKDFRNNSTSNGKYGKTGDGRNMDEIYQEFKRNRERTEQLQ